jgi:hypothetical protein
VLGSHKPPSLHASKGWNTGIKNVVSASAPATSHTHMMHIVLNFKARILNHQTLSDYLSVRIKWWYCSGKDHQAFSQLRSTQELSSSRCKSFHPEGNCRNGWEAYAKSGHASVHRCCVFVASAIPFTSQGLCACWMWVRSPQLQLQGSTLQ